VDYAEGRRDPSRFPPPQRRRGVARTPTPCPVRGGWRWVGYRNMLATAAKSSLMDWSGVQVGLARRLTHRVVIHTLCVEPWVRLSCPGGPGVLLCLTSPRRLTTNWPGSPQIPVSCSEKKRGLGPGVLGALASATSPCREPVEF